MNKENRVITRREWMWRSAACGFAFLASPVLSFAQGQAAAAPAGCGRFDDLAAILRGDLVTPGDANCDEARQLWNAMIDKHPAAIARCTGVADVMTVGNYARDNGVPVSVRGGGHNVAG